MNVRFPCSPLVIEARKNLFSNEFSVVAVRKLGKLCHTDIVSVGPGKEPEKKKEEPRKEEPKKPAEPKKDPPKEVIVPSYPPMVYHPPIPTYYPPLPDNYTSGRCVEGDRAGCVIC